MLDPSVVRRVRGLRCLVGNTPLLAISLEFKGEERVVYAKAENLNMTGSIKDRMVLHIIQKAHESGALEPGAPITEATSGNTGISVAAVGAAMGHPVTIFMPDWMSEERINLIRSLGATVSLVSKEAGGFLGSIRFAEELGRREEMFLPRQFSNENNVEAHAETTGPEIWWQLRFRNLIPGCLRGRGGNGGDHHGSRGVPEGRCTPGWRFIPLEPANSPTLTTGHCVGKHRIQGISDEFIPPIVDLTGHGSRIIFRG